MESSGWSFRSCVRDRLSPATDNLCGQLQPPFLRARRWHTEDAFFPTTEHFYLVDRQSCCTGRLPTGLRYLITNCFSPDHGASNPQHAAARSGALLGGTRCRLRLVLVCTRGSGEH